MVLRAALKRAMARVKCAKPERFSKAQRQVFDLVSGRRAYPTVGVRVPRRRRAGKLAEREVKKYMDSTELLIPKQSFQRLVREITSNVLPDLRMQSTALENIQHVAEDYMVQGMEDTRKCSEHAGRKTVLARDMRLVMRLRNGW